MQLMDQNLRYEIYTSLQSLDLWSIGMAILR
jgi:hypothetical protein